MKGAGPGEWPCLIIYKEGGEEMDAVIKAVVIGVLTVVLTALNQSGGDE